jgi:hypothetical protein
MNIVVPAHCDIKPMPPGGEHRLAPSVTANARVNPDGDHGVRWTGWKGELSAFSSTAITAQIRPASGAPFRLMVELSCTPAPAKESDGFRFALIAPKVWRAT